MSGTRRKDRNVLSAGDDDAGPSQPSQRLKTAAAHAEELPECCMDDAWDVERRPAGSSQLPPAQVSASLLPPPPPPQTRLLDLPDDMLNEIARRLSTGQKLAGLARTCTRLRDFVCPSVTELHVAGPVLDLRHLKQLRMLSIDLDQTNLSALQALVRTLCHLPQLRCVELRTSPGQEHCCECLWASTLTRRWVDAAEGALRSQWESRPFPYTKATLFPERDLHFEVQCLFGDLQLQCPQSMVVNVWPMLPGAVVVGDFDPTTWLRPSLSDGDMGWVCASCGACADGWIVEWDSDPALPPVQLRSGAQRAPQAVERQGMRGRIGNHPPLPPGKRSKPTFGLAHSLSNYFCFLCPFLSVSLSLCAY